MWNRYGIALFVLLTGLLLPVIAQAQQQTATTQLTPQQIKEQTLGQWWLKNSLLYQQTDYFSDWLQHTEATYSFMNFTGDMHGSSHNGTFANYIRKKRYTNQFYTSVDKQKMKLSGNRGSTATEKLSVEDLFKIDLNTILNLGLGSFWERDDVNLIKSRTAYYIGLGFDHHYKSRHLLNLYAAVGRLKQSYTIPVQGLDVVTEPYEAFYLVQNYAFVINPMLTFKQSFNYLVDIDETDRYRFTLDANFIVTVSRHFSLLMGYNHQFDNEANLIGTSKNQIRQTISVSANY